MQNKSTRTTIIVLLLLLSAVAIGAIIYFLLPSRHPDDDRPVSGDRIVNIYDYEYAPGDYTLDLDGDGHAEQIHLYASGRYATIDGTEYIINPHLDPEFDTISEEVDDDRDDQHFIFYDNAENYYYILDLNDDGILDIIHRTHSTMVSPITNNYTIYNYHPGQLIEIGQTSIIGNIPNDLHVSGNTLRFDYWPYEAPPDFTESCTIKLNV